MPPKHVTRDRAWGTRYDTLILSSPPLSPSTQRKDPTTASSTPNSPSSQHAHDIAHSVPTATPVKSENTSQDTSIFIGSLPTTTDYLEINRLLAEHLSEHAEIRSVKVVRDSKGGTCAFAQCENATTAGRLLEKLLGTAHQRPFMGRYLRFEHARAFRTLLVSYRIPQLTDSSFDGDHLSQDAVPHHAMRIYKPPNGKYYAVIYDAEAVDFESKPSSQVFADETSNPNDPLSDAGLLLSPLRFDGESLRKITTAFGRVENFGPFVANAEGSAGVLTYEELQLRRVHVGPTEAPNLRAHSGPRAADMDKRIWEIKWEHRDDCMNAQMTLRNVPHLSVTWAHRSYPDTGAGLESRFGSPSLSSSPRFLPGFRPRTQSRSQFLLGGELQRVAPASSNSTTTGPRISGSPSHITSALSPKSMPFIPSNANFGLRTSSPPPVNRTSIDAEGQDATVVASLSDVEFPPLHQEFVRHPRKGTRPPTLSWTTQDMRTEADPFAHNSAFSTSPSSSLSVQPSTPTPINSLMSPVGDNSISSHHHHHDNAEPEENLDSYQEQELAIPPTPPFTSASITPVTPRTALSFPHTPESERSAFSAMEPCAGGNVRMLSKDGRVSERFDRFTKEVDPLWIFAGGLDVLGPNPWTEDRVREVFSKYGEIERLEFNRKQGSSCAFAFVKYPDTAASANAVTSEDMQMYNGRPIRVRLREMYPSRNTQRFPRSRTRQSYGPSTFRRSFESMAQLCDDLHVQPRPQHQDLSHRPFQGDFSRPSTRAVPEDVSQPTFPTIATPGSRRPLSSGTHSPTDGTTSRGEPTQDRPVSAASGSISSSPSSTEPLAVMGPMAPHVLVTPQQLMHPFIPYAYPVHYYSGYTGYPIPTGYRPGPSGGEANPSLPNQQAAYQPAAGQASQAQTQPPVRPAGFLEGDQLIPLYSPEALNQYMTASGQAPSQLSPPHGTSAIQPQCAPTPPGWSHSMPGPPQVPMYSYPYPPTAALGPSLPQPLMMAGQYPINTWSSATPIPYTAAPQGFPLSHSQTGTFPQPPLTPYSNSSTAIAMAPSTSFRGGPSNTHPLPAHATQQDFGSAPRGFPPAGPRRFAGGHGHAGHSGANATTGQGQFFRGVPRNAANQGHRSSPPHLNRRGSGGIDTSQSFGGDGAAPARVHSTSISQQHIASQPQLMQMRASGSYPSTLAPNGPMT
ncbi:uncharacterized protein PHACADRAFT_24571 [Phanerochaete carnosa HHB-10118-sp]|uniref:RRM domain-containing protein n=1 Tax=Phanerochaete carnosa (strain HHB-10118-sp) TaxID=650164 RepID=K5WQ76_PHACS|nr:uncharacterized protein PHACADRAFT_24571 [Phanerochaete carnosa HHB-10118-sp]EKM61369.1 hypothetical protein PHACADRAFT_24571 [Phanerochaete carnosa HHB-10118-sp]